MFTLLADESLNGFLVRELRNQGFTVTWILEEHAGIPDDEVIAIAKRQQHILITANEERIIHRF